MVLGGGTDNTTLNVAPLAAVQKGVATLKAGIVSWSMAVNISRRFLESTLVVAVNLCAIEFET